MRAARNRLEPVSINDTEIAPPFVFTVMSEDRASEALVVEGTGFANRPFANTAPLEAALWAIAGRLPGAQYLFAVQGVPEILAAFVADGAISAAEASEVLYRAAGGDVRFCAALRHGAPLHISAYAGAGHLPGFRFVSVVGGPPWDLDGQGAPRHGTNGLLADFLLSWGDAVPEIALDVRPYGLEDRDHVGIWFAPPVTRDLVRAELKAAYQAPYWQVELSPAEFATWELYGTIPLNRALRL